jgi:hypothetical protein
MRSYDFAAKVAILQLLGHRPSILNGIAVLMLLNLFLLIRKPIIPEGDEGAVVEFEVTCSAQPRLVGGACRLTGGALLVVTGRCGSRVEFRVRLGDAGVHASGLWLTLRSLAGESVKFSEHAGGLGCADQLEYL